MSDAPRVFNSLDDALVGCVVPEDIRTTLALVSVPFYSFEGDIQSGQLVVHQDLTKDIHTIFDALLAMRFPIQHIVPIAAFNWDDNASMKANNTSAFNYRYIVGTSELSNHSFGRAIDINPFQNPYYARTGMVYPHGAIYDIDAPGTIRADGEVVTLFKKLGWVWLGEREEHKDYQHFEKH